MAHERILKIAPIDYSILRQKFRRVIDPNSFKAQSTLAEELALMKDYGTLINFVVSYAFSLTCHVFFKKKTTKYQLKENQVK